MTATRLLAIAALLVTAGSCADGPGPDAMGTYVLRTVGDSTVPFVRYATGSDRVVLLADTLQLDGRGGSTATLVERDTYAGQPTIVVPTTIQGRYVTHADTVLITFGCPPNAACAVLGPARYLGIAGGMSTYAGPIAGMLSVYERIR